IAALVVTPGDNLHASWKIQFRRDLRRNNPDHRAARHHAPQLPPLDSAPGQQRIRPVVARQVEEQRRMTLENALAVPLASGRITLNWRLVQVPADVRDYVLLHELAHLRHLNHSTRFWKEVARLCPRFEEARAWLRANGRLLGTQNVPAL
ncbi:MAG: DUF45 domain-containing protein, partial [Acidobacteria bacterium]|nr:DUF45 domain-containing protein [Acidobacteriota bacterium]